MTANNSINNETNNRVNNLVTGVEPVTIETVSAAIAANNETKTVLTYSNVKPEKNTDIMDAIDAIRTAIATVKIEMLSPRAIVRAIKETMSSNVTIANFAARIGVTPTSNKKGVDEAVKKLLNLIPYYTETRIDEVHVITDVAIMQSTSVDGVYIAKICKDIFALLEQTMSNTDNIHVLVKPGKFYKYTDSGVLVETSKVPVSRRVNKDEARYNRLAKVISESKIDDILTALIAVHGRDKVEEYLNNTPV